MGFIEDIKNCFSSSELPIEPVFRAVMFGDCALYLENVRSIIKYTTEEISVSLKKGGLNVNGNGLYVKKYCAGDLVVCGNIKSIERI